MTQNQDVNRLIIAAGAMKTVGVSIDVDGNEAIITGNESGGGGSVREYTDASSTITTGGTAQTILVANSARTGISFQNISDTDMYLNTTGTATAGAGSYLIKAGGAYVTDYGAKDSQAISLLCATTGKAFTCKWW